MAEARKVIITCAVTGAIHTPTMSPHLPVTPTQIADAADRRGARPAPRSCTCTRATRETASRRRPEVFMQFLPRIKRRTDAVINITTGGAATMTLEERLAAGAAAASPRWPRSTWAR